MKTYKQIQQEFVDGFHTLNTTKLKSDSLRDKHIRFSLNYDQECRAKDKAYYDYADARKAFIKAKVAYDNVRDPFHISYYIIRVVDFIRK